MSKKNPKAIYNFLSFGYQISDLIILLPEFQKFSDLFWDYIRNYFLLLSDLESDIAFAKIIQQLSLLKVGKFKIAL